MDVGPVAGTDERRALARPDGERFRFALAGSSVTTFMMDRELRYTWMENPALGHVPDTVVGHTDADLLAPPAGAHLMAVNRRVVEHGESVAAEVAVRVDGADLWYWLTAHPIRDSGGAIIGLAGQSTEITERKRVALSRRADAPSRTWRSRSAAPSWARGHGMPTLIR